MVVPVQTLIPGAPASRMFVATNVTQHFRIDVTDVSQDLVIALSPIYGDPDLLLSSNPSPPYPGCVFTESPNSRVPNSKCSNFIWSQMADRQDVLRIQAANACLNPPANSLDHPCTAADWHTGTYIIGVFGYNASLYDITVQVQGSNTLIPGQSQTASSSVAKPAYFQLQVSALVHGLSRIVCMLLSCRDDSNHVLIHAYSTCWCVHYSFLSVSNAAVCNCVRA